jgi:hypothetical protein
MYDVCCLGGFIFIIIVLVILVLWSTTFWSIVEKLAIRNCKGIKVTILTISSISNIEAIAKIAEIAEKVAKGQNFSLLKFLL